MLKPISFLVLCLAVPSAYGAPDILTTSANDVSARLDAAFKLIQASESSGSNGQIGACIAAKDPSLDISHDIALMPGLSDELQAAVNDLVAVRARFAAATVGVSSDAMYDGAHMYSGDVCGAKPETVAAVKEIAPLYSADADKVRDACGKIQVLRNGFEKQYAQRHAPFVKYLPPKHAANCADTKQNMKAIADLLDKAAATCSQASGSAEEDSDRPSTLARRYDAGCEAAKIREDDYLDDKEEESERMRNWERHHPVGAMLCQGDHDCARESGANL